MRFSVLGFVAVGAILSCPETVSSCDDARFEQIQQIYDTCVEETTKELSEILDREANETRLSIDKCRKMEQLLECSAVLTECMISHFAESEVKLFSLPIDPSATNSVQECQQLLLQDAEAKHSIEKRSAGKNSGSRSRVSQVKSAVSSIVGGRNKAPAAAVGALGGAGLASKSAGGRGKILRRIGKYAVGGLAVYGTYKLGKSMAKGLKKLYDDDDCWEYSPFQDRYNCVCNDRCNVYINGAPVEGLTSCLLFMTTTLSLYNNYFRN